MNKMFLHIELQIKSSKLQKDNFPKIAEFINYDYSGNENIVKIKMMSITRL